MVPLQLRQDVYYSEIWFYTVGEELIVTYSARLKDEWCVGMHEGQYEPAAFCPKPPIAPTEAGMIELMQQMWNNLQRSSPTITTPPVKCELRCNGLEAAEALRSFAEAGKLPTGGAIALS